MVSRTAARLNPIAMTSAAPAQPLRRRHCLKLFLAASLLVCVLAVVAWQTRERWLAGMIHAWVVNDPVEHVDAIVVLGGGSQYRTFAAARLFKAGQTTRVLYPDIALSVEDVSQGRTVSPETELIGQVLEHEGVPRSAHEIIGRAVNSTHDEITAVRVWAEHHHARTIMAPTDPYHTRRLSRLGQKLFNGSETRLLVTVVDPPGYRWQEWWRDERGVGAFQTELIKSVLYAFK